jgi:subtilase family serine protease
MRIARLWALTGAVSTPGSAQFHHYLTDAAWVARYAPTNADATKAKAWLRGEGFSIGALPKDRLFVPASGSAA